MSVQMHPVKSSNIDAIGYDAAAKELHVKFKSGGVHAYADVPMDKYIALKTAPSIGKHFHAHVRDKHKSRKVT